MHNIILLIIFLVLNYFTVSIFKVNFGKAMPFTSAFCTVLMYLCGLFVDLNWIYPIICIIMIISIYRFIKSLILKNYHEVFKRYFNISFFVFMIIYFAVIVINYSRGFTFVDEFAHLGLMAKESYRLNEFHIVDESMMWYNKEYPPFYSLLEVFFCKFVGTFSEGYCYRALQLFSLSLLLPLFDKFSLTIKEMPKILITLISCFLIGMVINFTDGMVYNTLFYNSIYLDLHIGFFLAYLFYLVYTFDFKSKLDYINLSLMLSCFVLTKQISIAFYLLALVTFIIAYFKNLKNKGYLIKSLIMFAIPILFFISWNIVVDYYLTEQKFDVSSYNFFFFIDYFKGDMYKWQIDTVNNFFNAVFNRPLIIQPFNLSYIGALIIISLLIMATSIINKDMKKKVIYSLMYLLGGLGYAYSLLLSYVYAFGYLEGPSLAMFDRYCSLYLIFGFVFIFMISIKEISMKENNGKELHYLALLVVIIFLINIDTIKASKPILKYNGKLDMYNERYVNFINENPDKKYLVISQNDVEKRNVLRFYTIENDDNINYFDISYAGNNEYDIGVALWEDEYIDMLNDYDYLYICDYDDSFYQHFWKNITIEELKMDHFYSVDVLDNWLVNVKEIAFD